MATTAARWRWRLLVALAVVVGLLVAVLWWRGTTQPRPWTEPPSIDGAVVRLTYVGSECRSGVRADVDEDPARVTITIRETVRSRACSDVGVRHRLRVRLDEPLGDRRLVDGARASTTRQDTSSPLPEP